MSHSHRPSPSERDPEPLLQKILAELPGLIWTTDCQLRFTSSFGAALAIPGEQPNEVVGLSLAEYFKSDELRESAMTAHRRALTGETVVLENIHFGKTWQNTIKPLRDDQGEIVGVIGMSQDITATRQASEKLRESEELFRQIFERGPLGMVLVSADELRILKANYAFARMLGYLPEELIGRTLPEITPEEDRPISQVLRARLVAEDYASAKWEKRYRTRDGGMVWARATAVTQRDRYGNLYGLAMVEDISDQKEAELRLEEERENLRRLLHAHDRDRQLVSYEIHDGLAQQFVAALMQLEAYCQMKSAAPDMAQTAFCTAQQLLTQGLTEARRLISDLRPPILDESGVVAAIEHMIHDQIRSTNLRIVFRHKVRFERLATPLENALFRIVQESITNVARHSQSPQCLVRLTQDDDRVRLVVCDWGCGFDTQAVRDGAFGLRGIRERARLLGGRVSIRSVPGRGTRIAVELPLLFNDHR